MTYHPALGIARDPELHCDTPGCNTVLIVRASHNAPPAWLYNQRAPKGWRVEVVDGRRRDTCPGCLGRGRG